MKKNVDRMAQDALQQFIANKTPKIVLMVEEYISRNPELACEKEDMISEASMALIKFFRFTPLEDMREEDLSETIKNAIERYIGTLPNYQIRAFDVTSEEISIHNTSTVVERKIYLNQLISSAALTVQEKDVIRSLMDNCTIEEIAIMSGTDISIILSLRDTAFQKMREAAH